MTATVSDASVVICTYTEDRWDDFVASVESVRNQIPPPCEIIVVVDHNLQLLERVRIELPDVVVTENKEQQGLSGARNSGITLAKGQKVAFLDDDATAEPDWLERLNRWIDEHQVFGAGGRVEPVWLEGRPSWFPEEFYWVLGCTYRGMPQTADQVRNPFGGCMCIQREIFEVVGGFSSGIGRVGAVPYGCEETELCIRTLQHYPKSMFIYEPQAVIHHNVPPSRATWSYFRSRCFREGRSKALLSRLVGAQDALSTERTYTFYTLPQGVIRGIGDTVLRRDPIGLARAGAIIAGLAITTVGYLSGIVSALLLKHNKDDN